MLPPLSHPEGLLLMQTGFAVAAPCSTCQWWLHRHYHPECKAKDHITTPPLSGIQAILLDQYCRPEIWVAIYNAGVILYSHGRHATLNDQSNFITQACNHLMTIGSSYLDLGVVVHPAYSSRCHGGFLWAIRCFQCLTNQADCLEMTLLPVPEAKKSLVALIFSLTSQTEWILYISVSNLFLYAVAHSLPKKRPSGWEASLSSKWYFPVSKPPGGHEWWRQSTC